MAAYSEYITLDDELKIATSPNTFVTIKYKYKREGANMYYQIYFYTHLSSTGYRNDSHGLVIKLDDVEKVNNTTFKPSGSGNWPRTGEYTDLVVSNKTSGTTSLYVRFYDSQGAASFDWSKTYSLTVSPAMSTLSSVTNGTTLSGPTITVNKSNSGFTDNLYIYYGNDTNPTFSRSNFTSGKITFSESERRTIYNLQDVAGNGVSATWKIKGETYSGSTKIGDWTNNGLTFTLTTEAMNIITAANNFNVESSTTVTIKNQCSGKYVLIGKVGSTQVCRYPSSGVASWDVAVGSTKSLTLTPTASTIYNSNSTSKTGTITWYLDTYISDTTSPFADRTKTCTYTFDASKCSPSMSTFQYAVTDTGTQTLMSATTGYVNYNSGTNLNKFISNKTTLNLKATAAVKANTGSQTIKSYTIAIPGQANQTVTATSITDRSTGALTTNGAISIYVTDSRGFTSNTLSFSYTLNNYYTPVLNSFTAERYPKSLGTNDDKKVKVSYNISAPSFITSNSVFKVAWEYKAQSSSTWNGPYDIDNSTSKTNYTLSNGTTTEIFDVNTQYDLRLKIKDYYNQTYIAYTSIIIPVSSPLLAKRLRRLGINKIPDSGYALDVSGNIRTDGSMTVGTYADIGTTLYVGGRTTFNDYARGRVIYGSGSSGYFYVCDITHSGTYSQQFVEFTFLQRARYGKMILRGTGTSTTGQITGVEALWVGTNGSDIKAYYLLSNNKIQLYVLKQQTYDSIEVYIKKGHYEDNMNITWVGTNVTSLPTGYTEIYGATMRVSITGNANYATSAGTATSATSATSATNATNATNNSSGEHLIKTYSRAGRIDSGNFDAVSSSGALYRSGLYSIYVSSNWYNLINIRHGNGEGDGTSYGMQIRSHMTSTGNDTEYRKQNTSGWTAWKSMFGGTTGTQTKTSTATPSGSLTCSITWRYIKFDNGISMCWGRTEVSTTINTTWGNLKTSVNITLPNYPDSMFNAVPTLTYSSTTGDSWSAYICAASNNVPTATSPGNVFLTRGNNSTSTQKYIINIMAIGTWK